MPIPTLSTPAYLTQTQLRGHTPLNARAWELKSGVFCKESFSSQRIQFSVEIYIGLWFNAHVWHSCVHCKFQGKYNIQLLTMFLKQYKLFPCHYVFSFK